MVCFICTKVHFMTTAVYLIAIQVLWELYFATTAQLIWITPSLPTTLRGEE